METKIKILLFGGMALALSGLWIGHLEGFLVGLLGLSFIAIGLLLSVLLSIGFLVVKTAEGVVTVGAAAVKKASSFRFTPEQLAEMKKQAADRLLSDRNHN